MIICRLRFKGTLGTQAYCLPLLPEGRRPYILPEHARPIKVVVDPAITDPGKIQLNYKYYIKTWLSSAYCATNKM